MIWILFCLGMLLAVFGATAGGALVSVSRLELTRVVSRQLRGGPGSLTWLNEMEQYLSAATVTTSLGVVLVGTTIPALFTGYRLVVLAAFVTLVAVPLVLFAGYLVPRWLARPYAERVRTAVVPVLRPWSKVLGLLLPARAPVGASDLRALWRDSAAAGLGADEELLMVGGVMTFSERPVREVMTPRTDLVAIAEDTPLNEIAAVFAQSGYSRIPVYRGTLDDIVGMLHAFDLFKLEPGDPLPVRPVAVAPASRLCGDLLLDMQRERRHLAVVLDEFGGTLGIVTFEDLLEELVGEIFDEFDTPERQQAGGSTNVFEADGSAPLSAIEERFDLELPRVTRSTVGGLVTELAGRIPAPGERFLIRGLEFDIVQATQTRVERVLIRHGPLYPVLLAPAAGHSPR